MTENPSYKVIMLGTTDFPHGMAEVEKQTLIARSLLDVGCKVKFICKKSFNSSTSLPFKGEYKGIGYFYTSFTAKRISNRYINFISWIIGAFIEKAFLLFTSYDFAIAGSRNYKEIHWYSRIIHLRGKKLYLTHVEDAGSMYQGSNTKILKQIEQFNNKTWHIIDGALPISEVLLNQIKICNPLLPQMKIPVMVDLNDINQAIYTEPIDGEYFMFCGSAAYQKTIDFIIESYEVSQCRSKLLLVISAHHRDIKLVWLRVKNSSKKNKIILKSYLKKENLWGYYKNALALLIPLNFDQRDKARFPHKIGEYCVARKPIITSNWGEVPNYFKNYENAILLSNSDTTEFSDRLSELENNRNLIKTLGDNAFEMALREFSFRLYGKKILGFHLNNPKK